MLQRPGVSRADVLVAMLIVVVVVGLFLVAVSQVREAAAAASCQNNLKQIGVAMHSFHAVREKLPLGCKNDRPLPLTAPRTTPIIELYPYLEQEPTYQRWDPNVRIGTLDAYGGVVPW